MSHYRWDHKVATHKSKNFWRHSGKVLDVLHIIRILRAVLFFGNGVDFFFLIQGFSGKLLHKFSRSWNEKVPFDKWLIISIIHMECNSAKASTV